MGTELGEAKIPIRATLDKLDGDLNSARSKIEGVLAGISHSLQNLGKIALGGVVAGLTAVAGGLAFSVKEAMEAQEIDTALVQVLKATGGAAGVTADMANDLANSLMGVTRFSDETIKSAETVLLRFKSIGKDVFPQATAITLDLATALGVDASSAAIMLGKALETPGEGMLRLKAAGVALSDEQITMIKSMADAGDMAGAQKMIMDALASSVGGAAEAAGTTFAGKLDILKNNLSNVAESIGTAVLPMLTDFASNILTFVQSEQFSTWIANITEWLTTNLPIALQFVSDVWTTVLQPAIEAVWAWMSGTLIPFLQGTVFPWLAVNIPAALQILSDFWTNVLQPAIQTVWAWISGTLIPFLQGTVFPWLAVNIPAALQILSDFWTNVLQPAIQTVWAWISGTLIPFLQGTVFPWLAVNIPAALQILSDFWTNVLQPAIQTVWSWISGTLIPFFQDKVIPFLQEKIPAAIQTLSDYWNNTLLPAITATYNFITTYIVPIFETVIGIATRMGEIAITALAGFWQNTLLPALTDVYNFLNTYITPAFTWLKDNVIEPLGTAISNLVTGALTWVLDKLKKLKEFFDGFTLPDWLTPGSPTPFELGLVGIKNQLTDIDRVMGQSMLFNPSRLNVGGILPMMAMAGIEGSDHDTRPSYSSTTTIYTSRDPLRVLRASRHLDKLGETL